ncbi:MAG: hypothetical protein QNJ63_16775 [Calothrix sp. MO_192.B10]|nr:hypothetical protein [Calothrix sp. MO_192.B10]
MSNEANLPNTSDMVVVRAEQPLELIDFNFAKRVYKNMRHKNINYQYFFCYEDRTKKTIEKVVKMLRNISLVYGFHHEDIKAEKKYDEVINELINSLNNTFISNERKSLILNNQDIYGRNFRIPEVIANNLQGIIKNKISIYFIPRKASETFCIHQGINKKECYLRWGDKDYFINLPRSEVDRKLNAYKYDKEILEKQGIFYIHPESFNDIRQYFLEEIRDNFPDNIQRCFEDICLGKSNN